MEAKELTSLAKRISEARLRLNELEETWDEVTKSCVFKAAPQGFAICTNPKDEEDDYCVCDNCPLVGITIEREAV